MWRVTVVFDFKSIKIVGAIAFDSIVLAAIGFIILLSIKDNTSYFLEIILVFALIGFVGTIAFLNFLERIPRRKSEKDKL